jgi:hypothetical protein
VVLGAWKCVSCRFQPPYFGANHPAANSSTFDDAKPRTVWGMEVDWSHGLRSHTISHGVASIALCNAKQNGNDPSATSQYGLTFPDSWGMCGPIQTNPFYWVDLVLLTWYCAHFVPY